MVKPEEAELVFPKFDDLEEKVKKVSIPTEKLLPSRYQPRVSAYEKDEDFEHLAHLIKVAGLRPRPIVRPHPDKPGFYEIIAGNRRKIAIDMFLHWKEIPCDVIEDLPDDTALFMVGQDNSGRRAFYPYEKGRYFRIFGAEKKISADGIAKYFKLKTKAVWSWMQLADDIDFLVAPLDPDTRKAFILNASGPVIEELKKIKSPEDRLEGCKMVANGATIETIRMHVLASLNSSQRTQPKAAAAKGAKEVTPVDTVKSVLKSLKAAEGAQDYNHMRQNVEALRREIAPTLDQYMRYDSIIKIINNAEEASSTRIGKVDVQLNHQVDNKGNGLCVHHLKGKEPIIVKFKLPRR